MSSSRESKLLTFNDDRYAKRGRSGKSFLDQVIANENYAVDRFCRLVQKSQRNAEDRHRASYKVLCPLFLEIGKCKRSRYFELFENIASSVYPTPLQFNYVANFLTIGAKIVVKSSRRDSPQRMEYTGT